MATWEDVHELAMALPGAQETTKWGNRTWAVQRGFVWARPLRPRDVEEVGEETGPILAVRVAHEHEKKALLAEDVDVFFTIPHFDGHPTVLVRLDRISRPRLAELVVDAWAEVAPHAVVAAYLAEHPSTLE
ncbi:MmcQ/YjbR family DNA-binding protein [Pseudolysinimonas sp.]|uniref:MmcQ/YjbR family DNA-binding protein n=1 Tax=Pseudolysinimonas sp. TaxID=2680009 RepID=UPI003F7E7C90